MKKKYMVYGPVHLDMVNDYWQVVGPREGIKGTFMTKKEAQEYIEELNNASK